MRRLTADVLVLGGGAAGLASAAAAAERGACVILATRAGPLTSATVWSDASFEMEGGVGSAFALPAHPEDSPDRVFQDFQAASHGLGDERVLRLLAERALPTARWLEGLGVRIAGQSAAEVASRRSVGADAAAAPAEARLRLEPALRPSRLPPRPVLLRHVARLPGDEDFADLIEPGGPGPGRRGRGQGPDRRPGRPQAASPRPRTATSNSSAARWMRAAMTCP